MFFWVSKRMIFYFTLCMTVATFFFRFAIRNHNNSAQRIPFNLYFLVPFCNLWAHPWLIKKEAVWCERITSELAFIMSFETFFICDVPLRLICRPFLALCLRTQLHAVVGKYLLDLWILICQVEWLRISLSQADVIIGFLWI